MAVAGRAYVVREDSAVARERGTAEPGNVDRLYPYTLRGLTDALEEARFLSFAGAPQVVAVAADSGIRVIRKFEHGREVQGGDPPGPVAN
jgi:hypothetical protein